MFYLLFFSSCAALKINQVTSDSPRFDRYYKAAQKCLLLEGTEGRKKVKMGTWSPIITVGKDLLGITWKGVNAKGEQVRFVCAITPGYCLASQSSVDGLLVSLGEELEEKVAYQCFDIFFLQQECFVLGEKELNARIKEKKSQEVDIWASLLKTKAQ